MSNINDLKKRNVIIVMISSVVILTIIIVSYISIKFLDNKAENTISYQKTETVEQLQTQQYGNEARKIIQSFEMDRESLNIFTDPNYKTKLYTGSMLDEISRMLDGVQAEPYWIIATNVNVTGLRVLERNAAKMKIVACVDLETKQVNHVGETIESLPLRQFKGAYIFLLDESIWKLANFIDITDPKQALQDWDYMSENLKQITGDINTLIYKDCLMQ